MGSNRGLIVRALFSAFFDPLERIICEFLPTRRISSSVNIEFEGGDNEAKNETRRIYRCF